MSRPVPIAVVVATALLLSGCGSAPEKSGPAGVDGLQIPTPSADPDDFVDGIDNPWLPLAPGSTWVYETTGERPQTITVTVTDEDRAVQGVEVTVVHGVVTGPGGRVAEDSRGLFAQDTAGNVWSFGEAITEYDERGRPDTAGSWEAGVEGAQAGIMMLADPRLGDGYQQEFLEGEAEDRATVLALDARVGTPSGTYVDVLQTRESTPLEPGLTRHRYYAAGVGLVHEETVQGEGDAASLVSFTSGDSS